MTRISESELILPVLYLLSVNGDMSTSELITSLRNLLHPSGEDLEILKGRRDDKFSQKVRNLKAHDTLTRKGLVTETGHKDNSVIFSITEKGYKLFDGKKHTLNTLFTFPLEKTKKILSDILENDHIDVLPENELFFTEGGYSTKKIQKIRTRSAKLRNAAIDHYSNNGVIVCLSCSFEFNKMYGSDIGKSYIEMHHITPICDYKDETKLNFHEAIANIAPLCANCHRVVHIHNPTLSIAAIKDAITLRHEKSSI